MRVLTSMSDIRTKLFLGTSIGALAMIFVMAAGVDAFDTKTTTASQPIGLQGHVTVMAVHPDGSISYAQGDNAIITAGLDFAAAQLFGGAANDAFDCIRIGTGAGGTGDDIQGTMGATATALQQCDTAANDVVDTGTDGQVDLDADFTMLADDLTDGSVTISEAILENAAGNVLSHVALATDVTANLGTVVTITYRMSLT